MPTEIGLRNEVRLNSMTRLLIALLLNTWPTVSWAIDETAARTIAEQAAGCSATQPCQTRARFEEGKWVIVVWLIYGYRGNGEPILKPGGWIRYTIDQDGKIEDPMPAT